MSFADAMKTARTLRKRAVSVLPVARNSLVLSAGSYLAQALTAITYVLAAKWMGPADVGPVLAATSLGILVTAIVDVGLNSYTVREIARGSRTSAFEQALGIKSAIAAATAVVWAVAVVVVVRSNATAIAGVGIYVGLSILWQTLVVPLRAIEQLGRWSAILAVERCTWAIVFVGLRMIHPQHLAVDLVAAMICGGLVSSAAAYLSIGREHRNIRVPRLSESLALVRRSVAFGLASLAVMINRADVAIVGAVGGAYAAGIYGVPSRVSWMLIVVPWAVSSSLFPRVAGRRNVTFLTPEVIVAALAMIVVVTAGVTAINVNANALIGATVGNAYLPGAPVLQVNLIGWIPASVALLFSNLLQAAGHDGFVAWAAGASSVAGLGAVAVGTQMNGAIGASYGFVAMQLVTTVALGLGILLHEVRVRAGSENRVEQS